MNKIINWRKSKLSDCVEIVLGGTPSTEKNEYWDGDISWITPKDLSNYNSVYISKGKRNISELGLKNSNAKLLPKGSILLTTRAPVGYIAIAENELSTNQGFRSLIMKNGNISEFFYYLLKYNIDAIKNIGNGTTFVEVNSESLKNLEILLPPTLTEQERIASILSLLDEKIEINNRINKMLEEMAKTIYDYWFTQFNFPNDDNKPYKRSGGKMIYSKELGRYIPKGWEILKLNERFCFEKGIEIGAKNYSNIKLDNYIPFYRVGDLNSHCNTYTKKSLLGEKILQNNDVCVSFDGTVGKVDIGLYGGYSSGIRKIYDKNNIISNAEIYFIFKSDYIQKIINKYATGSNILHASESINNMYIAYNEKIYKIYRQLIIPLFNNILKCKEENQKLSEIRDFLLPLLMNGQAYIE